MTDTTQQSAEDIVNLIISNTASQYSEEWKPDTVYMKKELIKITESFAKQEVKESTKAILDDIEFGYDLDMIKSKLKHGDYN